MTPSIAVTGASGFIGNAVVHASSERLRVLVRGPHHSRRPGDRPILGALEQPRALDELLDGVDTLIHCANFIGSDRHLANQVNELGTELLVRAAERHGVRRIVSVSTSGVYGNGPFVDADEGTPTRPTSPTSATRLAAERTVRAAGGVVIRPHLVVGDGDVRVGPILLRALSAVGGQPWPSPPASVITAAALAQQIWWLAGSDVTGAVNAHHGAPVTIAQLSGRLRGVDAAEPRVPTDAARDVLRGLGLSAHQVAMLTAPSTFTSRIAQQFGEVRFELSGPDEAWYRDQTT